MTEGQFPKIAVQIPAWNQAEELADCLNSLKEVKYSNLEVVVVNNGEDNTSEIIKRDFQWVTLIEEGVDLGFCRANNIGFRYCLKNNIDYILLLNGDTKVFPDTISTLLQVMQNDSSIAIAGAKNILMENPYYTWGKYGEVKWGPMLVTTAGRFEPDQKQKQPPKDVDWVICNGCLIRGKVLEEIGLFDEDYWMADEDVEWSYRAKEKGYRTVYVDEAAILHKGSSSTNLANKKKTFSYGYFLGRNPFRQFPDLDNLPCDLVPQHTSRPLLKLEMSMLGDSQIRSTDCGGFDTQQQLVFQNFRDLHLFDLDLSRTIVICSLHVTLRISLFASSEMTKTTLLYQMRRAARSAKTWGPSLRDGVWLMNGSTWKAFSM